MENAYQYLHINPGTNCQTNKKDISRHPVLGILIPEPLSVISMPGQVSTSPTFAAQASPQPSISFSQAKATIIQNNYVKSIIGRSGEDRHITAILNEFIQMYGVFDGHAGKEVSDYLVNNLPQAFAQFLLNVNFSDEITVKNAITNAYIDLDKKMFEQKMKAGSTAVVALYLSGILYLVNLGDSRAVLFTNNGKILLETQDHKPNEEKQRIVSAGGFVTDGEPPRVNGVLAVSRAFGDFYLKHQSKYNPRGPVSVIPDITKLVQINPSFILLASDGLYDVFNSQDAVNKILASTNITVACDEIVTTARKATNDDITVMIIKL